LTADLLADGAVSVNMGTEVRWIVLGQARVSYQSEITMTAGSRPLLEGAIYRRLRAHPQVRFIQQSEVVGLATDTHAAAVTGVYLRPRGIEHRLEQARLLAANLVVDASGRDSHAPEWLPALGFPAPQETTISSAPGYATRVYQRPADFPADLKVMYVQPTPPDHTRGAIILPLEGNRWHVCMVGMAADYPPTDEAGFLAFAQSLPSSIIYDAIKDATPLSPIIGFRRGENRERRYDQLPRYLERFLVLGDAVYAFNPVYGQGMTIATISSLVLDQCLREQRERYGVTPFAGLARRFQTQLAEATAAAWQLSTGEDRRWAALRDGSELDPELQLTQRYMEQVIKASLTIPVVAETFYRVQQMIDPPTAFFRPDIVLQVFGELPLTVGQPEQGELISRTS
jgi:2-polyprenyl-6-methoxyphenol hydroxylase-like FAD-dependent oxidoreductase